VVWIREGNIEPCADRTDAGLAAAVRGQSGRASALSPVPAASCIEAGSRNSALSSL